MLLMLFHFVKESKYSCITHFLAQKKYFIPFPMWKFYLKNYLLATVLTFTAICLFLFMSLGPIIERNQNP